MKFLENLRAMAPDERAAAIETAENWRNTLEAIMDEIDMIIRYRNLTHDLGPQQELQRAKDRAPVEAAKAIL